MANLEVINVVLAAIEAAPAAEPAQTPEQPLPSELGLAGAELARALSLLAPDVRVRLQRSARQIENDAAAHLLLLSRTLLASPHGAEAHQLIARMVEDARNMSPAEELLPSDDAVTTAFARGAAEAIAVTRASGRPVFAMRDGKVVEVPAGDK